MVINILYPAAIDNNTSIPDVIDGVTAINAAVLNRLKTAIIQIEEELGINPAGIYATIRARLDYFESIIGPGGNVVLGGDLSGTAGNATVIRLQNNPIKSMTLGAAQDGYVLTWNNTAKNWEADFITSGSITLGGDVTGATTSNHVVKLQTIPISSTPPTINQILKYNGTNWAPETIAANLPITFQPGGTAEANVYVTEASLNAILADSFGPQTVYLDLSQSGNAYTATGNINFGSYLIGVAPGLFASPSLTTSNTFIQSPVEIRDVYLTASGGTTIFPVTNVLRLTGDSSLIGGAGGSYVVSISDFTSIELFDQSIIGDNINPAIHVTSTGFLFLPIFGSSYLYNNAITIDPGGTVLIIMMSPASGFDLSYFVLYNASTPGLSIQYQFTPAPVVTFSPGGSAGQTVFTDPNQLFGYLKAVGGLNVPLWTVQCDFRSNIYLSGSTASLNGFGSQVTLTQTSPSPGFTPDLVGTSIFVTNADGNNVGNFIITAYNSPTSITFTNYSFFSPETLNGSIVWSISNIYVLTNNLTGNFSVMKGIVSNNSYPILKTNGHSFTDAFGPSELDDIEIFVQNANFIPYVPSLDLRGHTTIISDDGNYLFNISTAPAISAVINTYDYSIIGDGYQPVIGVESRASLTINAYGSLRLKDNAIFVASDGYLTINIYSPSAVIDASYFSLPGTTINYFTTLQGYPVSDVTPVLDQVLTWNGSIWIPEASSTTGNVNVTSIKTVSYTINRGDYFVPVDVRTAPATITLPASPTIGDTYIIKDVYGASSTNNITINGGAISAPPATNIDGFYTYIMLVNYESLTVTFTGLLTGWSVS